MPLTTEKPKRFTVRDKQGAAIGKAELRSVPVSAIKLDSHYQRDLSNDWVSEHLPFDPQRAGVVVLSGRLGGPFCIDGQHRVALARASDVSHINAYVIEGLTQRDEARLFTQYQRERRGLTAFALYKADIVAGDENTVAMDRIVRVNGFIISKSSAKNPNAIVAIDALRYVQRLGGDDLLSRTLRIVRTFWIGEEKALSGQVIKGVGLFLDSAGEQSTFSQSTFEKVLNSVPPVKLLRLSLSVSAKRGAAPAATPANVAEALNEQYNKLVKDQAEKLRPLTIGKRARPNRVWAKDGPE